MTIVTTYIHHDHDQHPIYTVELSGSRFVQIWLDRYGWEGEVVTTVPRDAVVYTGSTWDRWEVVINNLFLDETVADYV
jgi:hypothetical protein